MKVWVVKCFVVVALMFLVRDPKYSAWHFFVTLFANALADGGFVFTLCTVASIAHQCETNTFAAFWFWCCLAATFLIASVAADLVAPVMLLALGVSAYVVFNNMLPKDEEEYTELADEEYHPGLHGTL